MRDALLDGAPAQPPFGTRPVQFVDVFPNTPDRKVHLYPGGLAARGSRAACTATRRTRPPPTYPLALISPASEKTISSTLGELRAEAGHASRFTRRTRRSAASRTATPCASTTPWARCTAWRGRRRRCARGTVSLPKGLWQYSTLNGATANALAPDTLTDLGGGACFNDARVEVTKHRRAPSWAASGWRSGWAIPPDATERAALGGGSRARADASGRGRARRSGAGAPPALSGGRL